LCLSHCNATIFFVMKEGLRINREKAADYLRRAIEVVKFILALPLTCGYVKFGGAEHGLHDHNGRRKVTTGLIYGEERVPYNEQTHGEVYDFIAEGDRVPGFPSSLDGRAAIHRHDGPATTGSQEYRYEVTPVKLLDR